MEPKPGLKTSELWLTIIVIAIASIVAGLVTAFPNETAVKIASIVVGGIVTALTAAGYIISRTMVKDTVEKEKPKIPVEEPLPDPPSEDASRGT